MIRDIVLKKKKMIVSHAGIQCAEWYTRSETIQDLTFSDFTCIVKIRGFANPSYMTIK